ncbi:MAG: ATP-binding protein [Treponema sp.]|nr:ATP-binding protein [Treponema sp.]
MTETFIGHMLFFGFALTLGTSVSILFAGIEFTRKNKRALGFFYVVFLIAQTVCLWFLGWDMLTKLYPLLVHLPLICIFSLYNKRPWSISAVSVFSAFLCCQPPLWALTLCGVLFDNRIAESVVYGAAAFLTYYVLKKNTVKPFRQLIQISVKSCLILSVIPFLYYLLDYGTTTYTGILFRGAEWAVYMMFSAVCIFYFVFIVIYHTETQKQARMERERDMLDMQFRLAQTEFDSLRQVQQNAAVYRHDMRHHFAHLQGLVSRGRMEEAKEYLQTAQSDMDAITPVRFCENETVNLILSAFAAKAQQSGIQLEIDAKLPDSISFSDTELCSLLSNALENAIHACEAIPDRNNRFVTLRVYSRDNKLCIDIRNRYQKEPVFDQSLPVSTEQGHGFGVKSMARIVEKHGGVYQFSVEDGWFIFQATA